MYLFGHFLHFFLDKTKYANIKPSHIFNTYAYRWCPRFWDNSCVQVGLVGIGL